MFRRILTWIVLLLLTASAVGGGYVWHIWTHTDEYLHQLVMTQLHQKLPNWEVELGRAIFDFQGLVRLYDLKLQPPSPARGNVQIPELVISLDREQLANQQIDIHQIRCVGPQVNVFRAPDGTWLFPDIPLENSPLGKMPEWIIQDGQLTLNLEQSAGLPSAQHTFRDVSVQLTPAGKQRWTFRGDTEIESLGHLDIEGHWYGDSSEWQVTGGVHSLQWRENCWGKLCTLWPAAQARIESLAKQARLSRSEQGLPAVGLQADGEVLFRFRQVPEQPLEQRVCLRIQTGGIEHPSLPQPLENIQGVLYWDGRKLTVPKFSAQWATSTITLEKGHVDCARPFPDQSFGGILSLTQLPLGPMVRSCLPPQFQEMYDDVGASGIVDLKFMGGYSPEKGIQLDYDLKPINCQARHARFPYLMEQIKGLVRSRGGNTTCDLTAIAGTLPIKITAEMRTRGPNIGANLTVSGDNIPLDETLIAACPTASQETLRSLNVTGTANMKYETWRVGPLGTPWTWTLDARIPSATMTCRCFPYTVEELSGRVRFDGRQWHFEELKGQHGPTQLTASGNYLSHQGRGGHLRLTVANTQGEFQDDLRQAMPESWRKIWGQFSPEGQFNGTTDVDWHVGQPPEVTFDGQVVNSAILLQAFPLPIRQLNGQVKISPRRVDFIDITGRHDESRILLKKGWAEVLPDETWRARLDDLIVEDLVPNNRVRRALPQGFGDVIETLNPREGVVSLVGMLEFRGANDSPDSITAAWDMETICTGLTVTAGIDLKHLYGKVITRGTWDGETLINNGWANLNSMSILGYQFSQVTGPLSIKGNQLTIGSKEVISASASAGEPPRVPIEKRISGRAIDGVFTLDGIAVLGTETSYRDAISMNDARLERYAELYLPDQHDLRGVMNGRAELSGRGNSARALTGRGELRIRPAAIYQLPVILALFKVFQGVAPDNTAFDEAYARFEINNSRFDLLQADLLGAAMNLRGRGWVRFDRRVHLDFYSTATRPRSPLGVLTQPLSRAADGWIGVEVRGTLDNPQTNSRAVPQLDDALKNFLGALGPRPQPVAPRSGLGRLLPQ